MPLTVSEPCCRLLQQDGTERLRNIRTADARCKKTAGKTCHISGYSERPQMYNAGIRGYFIPEI